MLDCLIKHGTIIDGTGKAGYIGSIGIQNGKICDANGTEEAKTIIDATGKIICPGFIDAHSHGDLILGRDFARLAKTSQGVTTEMAGQCGLSAAPINPETMELIQGMLKIGAPDFPDDMINWTTYERYLEYCDSVPKTANIKSLVGHSTLRVAAMGFDNRECTEEELEKMKDLLRDAMEHGAAGLSTGLIYTPSCYATTHEVVELAKVIAPYGGFYASHMRNESDNILEAVEEVLTVGREAGVPVVISHHKVMGKKNWDLQQKTLQLINKAVEEGIQVTCDQYPYTWNQTALNVIVPAWHFDKGVEAMAELLRDPDMRAKIKAEIEDTDAKYDNFYLNAGGWEGVMVTTSPATKEVEGKTIAEYARELDKDPWDTFFDILVDNKGDSSAVFNTMKDQNLFDVITDPNTIVGSDGLTRALNEKGHPRAYATMPRAINYFVRENGVMSLEAIINKMTGLTAQRLGFKSKGILAEGYDADILVIDYDNFYDRATYVSPCELTDGIDYVIVNGEIVWHDKQFTGATPGKIIPHNQ